jgi:threonine dehydrogenase-like Zn-dependent dehydrogenase
MKAITVHPGLAASVRLDDVPEPDPADGAVLVETIAAGVCGTDRDLIEGAYGAAPAGRTRLVLGHESLGRVRSAPEGCGLLPGQLVVGIVRRPDPVPCEACAAGEWDMCRNGRYREHGIKDLDGFCRERFRMDVDALVPVDNALGIRGVLLEPASIVAKAWTHVDRIGGRSRWTPRKALVLGAGPVGLLAALFARHRGLDVFVLDRVSRGPKPELVRRLGATYFEGAIAATCVDVDIVIECTGSASLVLDAMKCVAPNGIVCLTGLSSRHRVLSVDIAALNNGLVLDNNVVFGAVNANRLHYDDAARTLAETDQTWLDGLITRRVPLEQWRDAYESSPDDVKTVLQFAAMDGRTTAGSPV